MLLELLKEQTLFCLSIFLLMFLPGYLFIGAFFRKSTFDYLEKFILSFGLSIALSNFLIILIGKIGVPINKLSILSGIAILSLLSFLIRKATKKRFVDDKNAKPLTFSKNQTILFITILFLTLFIKTSFLSKTIFPTATDLGHHMYWSKLVSETGKLPVYEKINIDVNSAGNYFITQPEPIADFIIGEHLIFSAINLISGIDIVSYFPTLVLHLVNILGVLATFVFVLKVFEGDKLNSKNIALIALLLVGPLYAISSPQTKFVSGGVIGNVFGNFFIPLCLLLYYRALREKNAGLLALSILVTAGMFYIHHLSSFIFIFIFGFTFILFNLSLIFDSLFYSKKDKLKELVSNYKKTFSDWTNLVISTPVMTVIISVALFFFFVYTPTYFESSAIDTAVGTPSKSTREGLSLTELKFSVGESKMILGLLGFAVLSILHLTHTSFNRKKSYSFAFSTGWLLAILLMTNQPDLLRLDLPSGRVANYFSFPIIVTASYFIYWILSLNKKSLFIPGAIQILFAFFIFNSAINNGFFDNSESLLTKSDFKKANQLFHASEYLAGQVQDGDIIVKDHNYLQNDTWMKLFIMKDYNYPFSRSYFKRYEDSTKPREMCTLWMISEPNSERGQKCFSETKTNYVVVNPENDSIQFEKSDNFSQIYAEESITIFHKNK